MSADEEDHEKTGYRYGRSSMRHNRHAFRLRMGVLLIIIGVMWFSAKMGWLDLSWLHVVPFWPLVIILIGAWMVYEGSRHLNK